VRDPNTLSFSDASELFGECLEDYDGRLAGGWRVDPSMMTFTRRCQSFRIGCGRVACTPSSPPPHWNSAWRRRL
jgi:hypothetical protein